MHKCKNDDLIAHSNEWSRHVFPVCLVFARDQGWIAFIDNFLSDGVPFIDPCVKCHLDWKFSQRNASACILPWSKSNLVYIEHITLLYCVVQLQTELSCVLNITSVELCCLTFRTFKCKCVSTDWREMSWAAIYLFWQHRSSTDLESVGSLKSLWMSCSRDPGEITRNRASPRSGAPSIKMDPGCVFSIRPVGDTKCPARTQ